MVEKRKGDRLNKKRIEMRSTCNNEEPLDKDITIKINTGISLLTTSPIGHFRVLSPLYQNESKSETIHMKMRSA